MSIHLYKIQLLRSPSILESHFALFHCKIFFFEVFLHTSEDLLYSVGNFFIPDSTWENFLKMASYVTTNWFLRSTLVFVTLHSSYSSHMSSYAHMYGCIFVFFNIVPLFFCRLCGFLVIIVSFDFLLLVLVCFFDRSIDCTILYLTLFYSPPPTKRPGG